MMMCDRLSSVITDISKVRSETSIVTIGCPQVPSALTCERIDNHQLVYVMQSTVIMALVHVGNAGPYIGESLLAVLAHEHFQIDSARFSAYLINYMHAN